MVDYQATYALITKVNLIRVLLSLTASLKQLLQQLDVKNTFSNGDLEGQVFMDVSLGFENVYGIKKGL